MSTWVEEKDVELVPILDVTSRFADGYHDGKNCRRDGSELPRDLRAGVDDYARGFRTGYYMRP